MGRDKDNYAIQAEYAKGLFLKYDQEEIIRKLSLRADEDYLYLPFLDYEYRIHRKTASVEKRIGEGAFADGNSFNEVLTVFDVLCYSKAGAQLAGEWVTLASIGRNIHSSNTGRDFFSASAKRLEPYEDRLDAAFERLGGRKMPVGEPGYVIFAFPVLPVYVQYWRGDEEFPPQLRFLFDANAAEIIHYETMYYLIGFLVQRLLELLDEM